MKSKQEGTCVLQSMISLGGRILSDSGPSLSVCLVYSVVVVCCSFYSPQNTQNTQTGKEGAVFCVVGGFAGVRSAVVGKKK